MRIVKKISIFYSGISYIFISNLINKFLGFFIFYFLAKHLSIKNYGLITLLLAVVTTVTDLINSGLNASLIRFVARFSSENKIDKINKLISTIVINYIFIGIILMTLLFLFSEKISLLILKIDNPRYIYITGIGIFLTFFVGIFSSYYQGKENYKYFCIQSTIVPFFRFLLILLLIFSKKIDIENILILFNITPIFAVISGFYLIKKEIRISIRNYSIKIMKEVSGFGKWLYLWSIFIIISSRINIYLLSMFASKEEISYFDVANKFYGLITMIITIYSTTLNPKFSKLINKREIEIEIKKMKKPLIFFTLYLVLSSLLAPLIIKIIFGQKYNNSIIPLIIQIISYIFFISNFPYNSSLFALGKSNIFFISSIFECLVTMLISYFLLTKWGAIGASLSQMGAIMISCIISRVAFKYYMRKE